MSALRSIKRILAEDLTKPVFPDMQKLWIGTKPKTGKKNWTQELADKTVKHLKAQIPKGTKK